ncbi:hypothetical protein L313_2287 [Acinetobacter haemolyticus CIP 64.3 = MTCC 9819]|uniref:Lipoprotein n=1 Tax=Acinetobacter haemolyticus CIP 64.3 = MTCC 9819 TaxID=1217659 RepID=N9GSD7_ACIHA|nr:hypothetical protein [Acinetobacter haemolyticus]ENW20131.1 hypothetical protein F927_00607 [Acinetobacter haemolyticus CIP 64.3 = MTCC 9819]EPR88641.1 hypothetical protein L313_2287 [Acinetobacter haemolyticus CIP 64.3 = MTCC 9819]QXZ27898.1 hypothetical protein I6L22_06430 [Acinetobacter haemolyticus]SPT47479.1 Uncharacterised protein [Acinetobacter haemolyticus]SUU55071.1 Uncharacterised protein [Acinetobacter haemolyticus]
MNRLKQTYLLSVLFSSVLLSACGGSSNSSSSSSNTQKPEQPAQSHEGRLAIANADTERPSLSVYDLKDQKVIDTKALNYMPSAMYSSPQLRYAVMLSRNNGVVQFADGGVFTQSNQLKINTPNILTFQLSGTTPAHYRSFNGTAALFYDGSASEVSKFEVFTDSMIAQKSIATQKLPKGHHGVAEPRGEYVLSTYMPTDASTLSIVKSYHIHGDHFHEEQSLTNPCNRLHGAASIAKYAAFGCEDGVLVVEQKKDTFVDKKIKITDQNDQLIRISTIAGHEKINQFAAFASGTHALFIVDPEKLNATSLNWSADAKELDGTTAVRRLQQSFDATGRYLAILDSMGTVHVIDTQTWQRLGQIQAINNVVGTELSKSRLVVNAASDTVFINNTEAKTIIELDLKNLKIKQTIQLNDVPNTFTWLGVAKMN